jgi:pantothenate kinase
MTAPTLPTVPPKALERVRELLSGGGRKLLGLVGPPGAGKSTLALAIQREFPEVSQLVPMDGFHLAQNELHRLDRAARKGAPDTFDSTGYLALLRRLRGQASDEIVYAPAFRREIEEPIAGAIPIHPHTQLVITEGNYLLLEGQPWALVGELLDDVWYVDVEDGLRVDRLTRRHEQFGRSRQDAINWVEANDEVNACLIALSRPRAKFRFQWSEPGSGSVPQATV